jgi:hypothetical protein
VRERLTDVFTGESGGVQAWLGRSFTSFDFELALARHMGGTRWLSAVMVGTDGEIVWEESEPATQTPTLLRLRKDVLEAIARAVTDIEGPSPAMQAHLKDAIAVRDRLLTLVETERTDV